MAQLTSSAAVSRRSFLRKSAAIGAIAVAGPAIVPASALGVDSRPAPSNRLTIGCIGIGNQGRGHFSNLLGNRDVQVLAACDVRKSVRDECQRQADDAYARVSGQGSYRACDAYNDFREVTGRSDIDAVLIATPDHWHALISIDAMRNGKDVYCEKPLTRTIGEALELVEATRRYGRVFQTGSQQRSSSGFRTACELVRNGRIGTVQAVYVNIGGPSGDRYLPEEPVPAGLDWEMWLGPSPWAPYSAERCSGNFGGGWRLIRDYSGGMMTDWGAHHFDIAQWGLGMDGSGPVQINPPDDEHPVLTFTYANGVKMYHVYGSGAARLKIPGGGEVNGLRFVGSDGWVEVNRGHLRVEPAHINRPMGANDIRLYASRGHMADWLECIRTRNRPICDVAVGASSVTVCHLGNIAYWLSRPIRWDPVAKCITGDEEASRWIDWPKRAPWTL